MAVGAAGGVTVFGVASGSAAGWVAASPCMIVVISGGAGGGIPFALTIAQCHSWSGKSAKFKGVRKVAVVDGAADPFACSRRVTSGCLWVESGACGGASLDAAGIIRAWP